MQYDLFDPPKRLARRTDPATSHEAAASIPLTELRQMFLDALRKLGSATANEVKDYWIGRGVERERAESIRKRASELSSAYYKEVRVTPSIKIITARKCRITGKSSQVYEVCK